MKFSIRLLHCFHVTKHYLSCSCGVFLFTKLPMILQTRTCNNHYVDNAKSIIPSMFCIKDIHCTIVCQHNKFSISIDNLTSIKRFRAV